MSFTPFSSAVASAYPKRHIAGLLPRSPLGEYYEFTGSALVSCSAGVCRDSLDAANIVAPNLMTATRLLLHSPSNGLGQLGGMDEKGLDNLASGAITCQQTGLVITASGNVLPHYQPKNLTGTISSSGITLTGVGTKFLTELSYGDVVGTDVTYGFVRVVNVLSDTQVQISATPPGGAIPGGTPGKVIHNATVLAGSVVSFGHHVHSITANGLTITLVAAAGSSNSLPPGSPLTIGVIPGNWAEDAVVDFTWVAIWVVTDGVTPGLLLSTQHQTLLAPPPGYSIGRRVGWILFSNDEEQSSGGFWPMRYEDGFGVREARFFGGRGGSLHTIVGTGGSGTWNSQRARIPRTSRQARARAELINQDQASTALGQFRERNAGHPTSATAYTNEILRVPNATGATTGDYTRQDVHKHLATDWAQYFDGACAGPNATMAVDIYGWVDFMWEGNPKPSN